MQIFLGLGSVPRIAQDIRVGGEAGAVVCNQILKDLVPVLLHKIHHNELRNGTMTGGDCRQFNFKMVKFRKIFLEIISELPKRICPVCHEEYIKFLPVNSAP